MSYDYRELKSNLFTEQNQIMFLKIRDRVNRLLNESGAVTMAKAVQAGVSGDNWTMMSCVDRLVELGEIREVAQRDCCGQDRIFVRPSY